jgi:protein-tyrosine-phosphatase
MRSPPTPLFLCHANCSRSVLASYLYRQLCPGAAVDSAGLDPGAQTSDRALAMLAWWGIDATAHQPTKLDRRMCDEASAIFVMAPPYLRRLLLDYGPDLARKSYLYADPFSHPKSLLGNSGYTVRDPSFDERPPVELVSEFGWMRDRTRQIRGALVGRGRPLIAAASYLDLLEPIDPLSH